MHRQSPSGHGGHRQLQKLVPTRSFSSMPEALDFYAKEVAEDGKGRGQGTVAVDEGVQRRRRRLNQQVNEEAGQTETKKRGHGATRRRTSRKRRQRKQVKLTMTADTGQINSNVN